MSILLYNMSIFGGISTDERPFCMRGEVYGVWALCCDKFEKQRVRLTLVTPQPIHINECKLITRERNKPNQFPLSGKLHAFMIDGEMSNNRGIITVPELLFHPIWDKIQSGIL